MKFARIILANLFRNKMRLFLTVCSFAVAFFLFSFLSVVRVAFHFWQQNAVADRLIVINRGTYFNTLPMSYRDKILQAPGIKFITHGTWFQGIYQDGKEAFGAFAIDPEGQRAVYPEFVVPEQQWQAFLKDRQGAIAGAQVVERLHWKIGDRIPLIPTMYPGGAWEFNLVGIYHGTRRQDDEMQFWFRWDYFDEKMPQPMKGRVGWYVLRIENASDAVRVSKIIDDAFTNSAAETRTQSESAFAANIMKQFTNIQSLILLIGGVVLFTLLLVTGNTMAIAVRERTAELGVFKAIGFSDVVILFLVIAESLIIALIGGALGLLASVIAIPALAQSLKRLLPGLFLSPQILVLGLLIVLFVGVADGSIPGIMAMRMRVVTAIRKAV